MNDRMMTTWWRCHDVTLTFQKRLAEDGQPFVGTAAGSARVLRGSQGRSTARAARRRPLQTSKCPQLTSDREQFGLCAHAHFLRSGCAPRFLKNACPLNRTQANTIQQPEGYVTLTITSSGDLCTDSRQTFQGSLSALSRRIFQVRILLESFRRDLHDALLCVSLISKCSSKFAF